MKLIDLIETVVHRLLTESGTSDTHRWTTLPVYVRKNEGNEFLRRK